MAFIGVMSHKNLNLQLYRCENLISGVSVYFFKAVERIRKCVLEACLKRKRNKCSGAIKAIKEADDVEVIYRKCLDRFGIHSVSLTHPLAVYVP